MRQSRVLGTPLCSKGLPHVFWDIPLHVPCFSFFSAFSDHREKSQGFILFCFSFLITDSMGARDSPLPKRHDCQKSQSRKQTAFDLLRLVFTFLFYFKHKPLPRKPGVLSAKHKTPIAYKNYTLQEKVLSLQVIPHHHLQPPQSSSEKSFANQATNVKTPRINSPPPPHTHIISESSDTS